MLKIIQCPSCFNLGVKQNVALILNTGEVSVRRRSDFNNETHQMTFNSTVIGGSDFYIKCGRCLNVVFMRERKIRPLSIISQRIKFYNQEFLRFCQVLLTYQSAFWH